ncbi:F-box protein At2g26160-like [Solanum verrucosum]|uniref:F-box protein At2g26160-like n=1 Tax=Solanum verrucosum TaxID=315347 RepID=UPI0020D122D6|nr:F-box protein At2g26160-like [Solanum verrucosum]
MADWAELPNDLISHIANRVKVIEDFIAFRSVCTSWRIAAIKDDFDVFSPQIPLLMLGAKHEDDFRELYSLSKNKVSRLFLPEVRNAECFPTEGWLCTVSNTSRDGEMNLLHPFSRTQIQLPSLKILLAFHDFDHRPTVQYVIKAVLSANPSITSDYVLMLWYNAHDGGGGLAFWRPGYLNWTHIKAPRLTSVASMIYHKGKYYYICYGGRFYNLCSNFKPHLLVTLHDLFYQHPVQFYLVEVSGALLLVTRFYNIDEDEVDFANGGRSVETYKFEVCELDVTKGELKEIKNLGDSTIFVGRNEASCIDSSKFTGIKPNHIYFTDDWFDFDREQEGGVGRDMGAYNLEDGKIESIYPELSISLICPPTWISPSFIM